MNQNQVSQEPYPEGPPRDSRGRIMLRMQADYGMSWPLSDACWLGSWGTVDWRGLLGDELVADLEAWCDEFTRYSDYETGDFFPPRSKPEWEKRGEQLAQRLHELVGDKFDIELQI